MRVFLFMKKLITRRRFLTGLIAAPLFTGLYSWRVEPTWVEFVHRKMPIANLPPSLVGKSLVQLSDLHIGRDVGNDYLRRTFNAVGLLKPAIVVYTGDFISYAGEETLRQLGDLVAHFPRGRLGTMAVLGNHDYGVNWNEPMVAARVAGLLTAAGCTVLRNQVTDVAGLKIVGMDDLWAGRLELGRGLSILSPNDPAMVLSHNPDTCDLPGWANYRGWILSGHTHGGQCKPPFLPPPLLPVKNRRYTAGEFELSAGRRLYINRGVGNLAGVRFNVRPEVTVFELGSG